jgi:hypothetical protein
MTAQRLVDRVRSGLTEGGRNRQFAVCAIREKNNKNRLNVKSLLRIRRNRRKIHLVSRVDTFVGDRLYRGGHRFGD